MAHSNLDEFAESFWRDRNNREYFIQLLNDKARSRGYKERVRLEEKQNMPTIYCIELKQPRYTANGKDFQLCKIGSSRSVDKRVEELCSFLERNGYHKSTFFEFAAEQSATDTALLTTIENDIRKSLGIGPPKVPVQFFTDLKLPNPTEWIFATTDGINALKHAEPTTGKWLEAIRRLPQPQITDDDLRNM